MSVTSAMGRLVRWGFAAVVSASFTFGSLVLVAALNPDATVDERKPSSTVRKSVPLAPPPTDPEPLDAPAEPVAAATADRETEPQHVEPPPPAAPMVADLAPADAPGSMSLGPIGHELPSVTDLPRGSLGTAPRVEARTPARPTHRPAPEYPALAQRRGIEGSVTVRLSIDERGRVTDAVVVESEPQGVFDTTALRAARQYRFSPAREGDRPVHSVLQQTIRFELQ